MHSAPLPPFALSRLFCRLVWGVLLLGLLAAGAPSVHAQSSGAPGDYTQTVAAAKTLVAENSWAKARDQYRAALALAPDADAKRWCELWLLEAEWRAEPPPDWQALEAKKNTYLASFDRLLKPYEEGAARDGYWRALMETRARFHGGYYFSFPHLAWQDRLNIADWLAEQPKTTPAHDEYFAFLRTLAAETEREKGFSDAVRERLIRHLVQAQKAASDDDERAWICWQVARLIGTDDKRPLAERQRKWGEAVASARGRVLELTVRTEELLWRIWQHSGEKSDMVAAPDYNALVAQMDELLRLSESSVRPEDRVCADAIVALQRKWAKPRLELPIPESLEIGQPLRLGYGACGVRRIEVAVYRCPRERIEAQVKAKAVIGTAGWLAAFDKERELVAQKVVDLSAAPMAWQQGTIEVAAKLSPGVYKIETRGFTAQETLEQGRMMLAGALQAASFHVAEGRTDLFVFDGSVNCPITGTEVRGGLMAANGENVLLSGATDGDGRISLPVAPHVENWRQWKVAAFVGERPLFCDTSEQAVAEEERYSVDLFLDRPIYRPGETVRWKLIVRERHAGRFHLPRTDRPLYFSIGNKDLVIVDKQPLVLDRFGTVQGECVIPDRARPGYFDLKLGWIGDGDTELSAGRSVGFEVDNFVPPQVVSRIVLASGSESLQPGKEVVFEVGAEYLSGGPVLGARVECTFQCSCSWRPDWECEENEKPSWRKWADDMRRTTLSGATNAQGKLRLSVQLPPDLPAGASCRLEGLLMPAGMPPVEVGCMVEIAPGGRYVWPAKYDGLRFGRVGESVAFPVIVLDGLRHGVAFAGTAQLVERQWSELWRAPDGRIVDERHIGAERRALKLTWGVAMPDGWKRLHAGFSEKTVAEQAVRADAEGNITPAFRIPHSGLFGLRLKSDSGDLVVLGTEKYYTEVLVPDENMAVPELPPDVYAIALPSEFSRDGPLSVLAVLPEGTDTGWLTLRGEDEAKCFRFSVRQRAAWVHADRLPRMHKRAEVELSFLQDNWMSGGTRSITIPDPALQLDVQMDQLKKEVRPGEIATLQIRAKATAEPGSPVSVSVASWDEALTQISGRRVERPAFWDSWAWPLATEAKIVGKWTLLEGKPVADPRLETGSLAALAEIGAAVRKRSAVEVDEEGVILLNPFEVSTTASGGYYAAETLAGSRLNTELREALPPASDVGAGKAKPEIEIRRHFAPTAFWAPNIVTDAKGEATVSFKYPDNLTQWRIVAYAVGADGNSFGMAKAFTRTSLPFQARLNLPRCLVEGDTAEAGAALLNRTDTAVNATATLEVSGAASQTGSAPKAFPMQEGGPKEFAVPAQGQAHAGWAVRAEKPGTAEFTLKAWTPAESDGMALTLPVLEDGILQPTAASGRLARGAQARELSLPLPESLDPTRTAARVQLTGSHAATMLDALPYLVDYPYGCVEQTMSRFLPAVVVKRTLGELGFDAAAVEARILGRETPAEAARRGKTAGLGRLDEVIAKSVARLSEAQCGDGGFGWWPGARQTDFWMTAYVLWGLELARGAGVTVPDALVDQTRAALVRRPTGNESADTTAWMLAALAAAPAEEREAKSVKKVLADCYGERAKLSATGRACLALAAAKLGTPEERAVLVRNLENGAERAASDDLGDTVHWGSTTNYWRASDGAAEATALTLLALLELEPQHALVEPAMNWLVLNRRSGRWESTRDTAFAVLALSKFLQVRGEVAEESEVEVLANGTAVGRVTLNRETLLAGPATLVLPTAQLRGGTNQIALRRVRGTGPVYAVALAEAWATGDTVKPAGHHAEVTRGFVRRKATPTLVGTLRIDPEPMANGGAAVAGEEVQAVVTVTVPNELEYVMVEVPKPAGCEPLNALSGWDAQIRRVVADGGALRQAQGAAAETNETEGRPTYREEHDDKSVFFLDRLEAGTWEIRFGMRAVTPGNFRALPVQVEAMYVPEIRANSDARRVRIERRE